MKTWDETPKPGSDDAVAQGCTCPVLDNGHGTGAGWKNEDGSPAFWIDGGCPLHARLTKNLFGKPDGPG